ncbi:MAG: hypothetical protein WC563_15705 [Brevundimonas sp.]
MPTAHAEKYGAVQVPTAVAAAGASLTTNCDPVMTGLLADFKSIINTKCAAAFAAAMGLKSQSGNAVDATYTHEPDPSISKLTWNGGALFLWRSSEIFKKRTNVHKGIESIVKLAYILKPMSVADIQLYAPIRVAVRTVLQGFIENKGDPNRKDKVLLSTYGLDSFEWTTAAYGYWDNELAVQLPFIVLDMSALMREREEWVLSQYAALSRVDTTVSSNEAAVGTDVLSTQYTP